MHPLLKLALDLGPLAAFFAGYRLGDIQLATTIIIPATLISLGINYLYGKKLAPMPLVTAVAVGVFGGLTLFLQNDLFIKMKPTIVNLLFACVLLGGNAMGRPMLKYLLESAIQMDAEGWRKLSFRWGIFFLFLAGLNEAIWRNFSTDFWVDFKVFGMFTCTLLFTLAQLPLMKRHMVEEPEAPE